MTTLEISAIQKLSQPASEAALDDFIQWLDTVNCEAWRTELPTISFAKRLLVTCVIALGREVLTECPLEIKQRIAPTVQAAEVFLATPNDETYEKYLEMSSQSYPFGMGDGCLSISRNKVERCKPGNGCISGSGTLKWGYAGFEPHYIYSILQEHVLPLLHDNQSTSIKL